MKARLQNTDVLKIDIDVKPPKHTLILFLYTRKLILNDLGYEVIDFKCKETKRGYHFWFTVNKQLSPEQKAELQFILGDDTKRCFYNFLRSASNSFEFFNALFSKKVH